MRRLIRQFAGKHPVLGIASALSAAAIIAAIGAYPALPARMTAFQQSVIAPNTSGLLIATASVVMIFVVLLALTPFGRVKLGSNNDSPEFGRFSWFAMLFSAGVGTGIMFWGVAEPIFHLQGNPFLAAENAAPLSRDAGLVAMRVTLFHWGLHGWAIYSFVGMCLAYFAYRRGLPLTIRSALQPLLGRHVDGFWGNAVDFLAIMSTLFGIAVSLGLGVSQMASGLGYLFGVEATPAVKLALILGVASIATLSAVSGIGRGIRRLSELNIWLSCLLIGVMILTGPTLLILTSYLTGSIDYFANFLPMGFWLERAPVSGWQNTWTLFYWGWWISWGPFVGMFMARVSRGRSIREYVAGTLLGPTLAGFLWLSVFGVTALDLELNGTSNLVEAVNSDMTRALFNTFEALPLGDATWLIAMLATMLIVSWFVTSSDSGTLVLCTIVSKGDEHPPISMRIFWGMAIALVAGLLLVAGGLGALQSASTAIAVPFSIVLLAMVAGLATSLWRHERG